MNAAKTTRPPTLRGATTTPATPDPLPHPAEQTRLPAARHPSPRRGISLLRAPQATPLACGHALGAPPLPPGSHPLPQDPELQ